MKFLSFVVILPVVALCYGCKAEQPQKERELSELQKDVRQLSEENQKLLNEIRTLRKEIMNKQAAQTQTNTAQTGPAPKEMSVDRMKAEIEPLLADVIKRIKSIAETPKKERQFGMRIEYDTPRAVHGLVRSEDPRVPFYAKVLVRYEKFLESERESKSYGFGNTSFLFAYRANRWVLESYQ